MSAPLQMCKQMSLLDTDSAISSPESGSGHTRYAAQDGLTIKRSGPDHAPAKPTQAQQEDETKSLIGGLNGAGSSLQDRLERSLANRLPLRKVGSLASAMIWKHWVMPSGRPIFRLSPLVRTIYALGFTLRATPTATANQAAPSMRKHPGCIGMEVSPESFCKRMGLPLEWLACAPSGTLSTQSLRRSSLRHLGSRSND